MQDSDGAFVFIGEDKRSDIVNFLNEGCINCNASGAILLSLVPGETKARVFCTNDKLTLSPASVITLPKHVTLLVNMTELSASIPLSDFTWPDSLACYKEHYLVMGIIRDIERNVIGAVVTILPQHDLTHQQRDYLNITRQRIELLVQYQLIHHPCTRKLADNEQLLNEIGKASHIGGWELDLVVNRITWTNEMYRFFDMSPGKTVTPERALANLPHDSRSHFKKAMKHTLKTATPFCIEVEYITNDGIKRWLKVTGNPQCQKGTSGKNKVIRVFGSVQDISQSHRLSHTQYSDTEYRAIALNNAPEPILTLDAQGTVLSANNAVNQMLGYDADELIGQDVALLVPTLERQPVLNYIRNYLRNEKSLAKGTLAQAHLHFRHRDGNVFPVNVALSSFTLNNHKSVVAVFHDMTQIQLKLDMLNQLAYFDSVTQLPNIHSFKKLINHRVRKAQVTCTDIYCAQITVQNITQYNQAFGRATGDYILRILASRLNRAFGAPFAVFRGDAFMFYLLYNAPIEEAFENEPNALAHVEHTLINDVFYDIPLHNSAHRVGANITACRVNGMTATVDKIMHMLATTNNNKVTAKPQSSLTYTVASCADYDRYQLLKQSLVSSVKNRELYIELQPQYSNSGNITCAEALLRWQHPELGLISPSEFIPIAEETDTIVELGAWVINESCKLLHHCQNRGVHTRLSINVSAKHIARADFSKTLCSLVKKWQVPPGSLTLELTEATLMGSFALVRKRIRELAEQGFAFSIDDFGTGTSNLNYLHTLPIKELKVDRHFIEALTDSQSRNALVNSICDMARAFDLRTVAEGIENNHQFSYAKKCGCNAFQGYYLDKPMHVNAWVEKLTTEQLGQVAMQTH